MNISMANEILFYTVKSSILQILEAYVQRKVALSWALDINYWGLNDHIDIGGNNWIDFCHVY
mgnify:CR=1 FL=1